MRIVIRYQTYMRSFAGSTLSRLRMRSLALALYSLTQCKDWLITFHSQTHMQSSADYASFTNKSERFDCSWWILKQVCRVWPITLLCPTCIANVADWAYFLKLYATCCWSRFILAHTYAKLNGWMMPLHFLTSMQHFDDRAKFANRYATCDWSCFILQHACNFLLAALFVTHRWGV